MIQIDVFVKKLPFSEEVSKFFAGLVAMFHVAIQDTKAIVLLSLRMGIIYI